MLWVGVGPGSGRWRTASAIPFVDTSRLEPAAAALLRDQTEQVNAAPRSAEAWGELGGILRLFLFKEEAQFCLAEAARLDPKDPRWPYLSGLVLAGGDPAGAVNQLRRAVTLCGNEPEAPRLHLARLLLEAGAPGEARAELEALLRSRPGLHVAQLALARTYQAENNWTRAINLTQPCTTNPYTARAAWTLLGLLHQRVGDTNAAQRADRQARMAAPDADWPDPIQSAFRNRRTDARSLGDRAEELLVMGKPRDALPLIEQLTNRHPEFAEGWLLAGRMHLLLGNPVLGELLLRRFLESETNSVNGTFQLGLSLLRQNRFEAAATAFQLATELKPGFGPAFFNLGFSLVKSGRRVEAVEPFREAIRHNPERIDSYVLLADLLLQLGRETEARELTEEAGRLDPGDPRVSALRRKWSSR